MERSSSSFKPHVETELGWRGGWIVNPPDEEFIATIVRQSRMFRQQATEAEQQQATEAEQQQTD